MLDQTRIMSGDIVYYAGYHSVTRSVIEKITKVRITVKVQTQVPYQTVYQKIDTNLFNTEQEALEVLITRRKRAIQAQKENILNQEHEVKRLETRLEEIKGI